MGIADTLFNENSKNVIDKNSFISIFNAVLENF